MQLQQQLQQQQQQQPQQQQGQTIIRTIKVESKPSTSQLANALASTTTTEQAISTPTVVKTQSLGLQNIVRMKLPTQQTGARTATLQLTDELRKKLLSGGARLVLPTQGQKGGPTGQNSVGVRQIVVPKQENAAASGTAVRFAVTSQQQLSNAAASSVVPATATLSGVSSTAGQPQRIVLPAALSSLRQLGPRTMVVRPSAMRPNTATTTITPTTAATPTQLLIQRPQSAPTSNTPLLRGFTLVRASTPAPIPTPAPVPTPSAQPRQSAPQPTPVQAGNAQKKGLSLTVSQLLFLKYCFLLFHAYYSTRF